MKVRILNNIDEVKSYFGLEQDGVLLETDLDFIENECELFGRKRRDAEVMATIAANMTGSCLDIGTSHGRSAFKLATNIKGDGTIFTVNLLPEQHDQSGGELITHLLSKEEIGSFYRQFNLKNIKQIYANTATWDIPAEIHGLSIAFIDGAHDTDIVYSDTKKAYERLHDGGFILWHDCSPLFRSKYHWIDAVMQGVERFVREYSIDAEIVNLRNSWVSVLRKGKTEKKTNRMAVMTHETGETKGVRSNSALEAMRTLRYVVAYPAYSSDRVHEEEGYISRIKDMGYNIEGFAIPCSGGWWPFPILDAHWRQRSPDLLKTYDALEEKLHSRDVLISAGGAMLHPEFIAGLPVYSVFIAADDPESSTILSKPAASAFDFAFTVNPGCVDMYRSWGCRQVDWIFAPLRPEMTDPAITAEQILSAERDIDIVFLGTRQTPVEDRAHRMVTLLKTFPQAFIAGDGWPQGRVAPNQYYARAKIGWNITNNNVGPNNTRTWHLPAMGVMQICDNKRELGKVFKLDEEVIGYDTLDECIEKTRYYLAHDRERRNIAYRGWKRTITDYTEERWWHQILTSIAPSCLAKRGMENHGRFLSNAKWSSREENGRGTLQEATSEMGAHLTSPAPGNNRRLRKPRILLLADRPGWAFDMAAQALSRYLGYEFEFRMSYVIEQPDLYAWPFDLLHVFFWGENYHTRFASDPRRVIKEVASHRWALEEQYGCVTPAQMVDRYLADAGTVIAISKRLQQVLSPHREVLFAPNGFEPGLFCDRSQRRGALKIGWAGNAGDPCKGLSDILGPATEGDFELHIAGGALNHEQMADFYNTIDILCVASTAEGEPLTLLEAMASGCFPVCVDVGIVPELVTHRQNGLVVNRNVAAFRAALQWCVLNTDVVREAGRQNAERMYQLRRWEQVIPHWRTVFQQALNRAETTLSTDEDPPSGATHVHSIPPVTSPSDQQVIANAKANYYAHFKVMNPQEATDAAYQGCLFYYNAELLPLVPADKDLRILDVGSGFGYLLRFLTDRGYRRVGGVEIDEELYKASHRYVGQRVEFIEHEDALNFLDKHKSEFDVITCFDMIEHFPLSGSFELAARIWGSLRNRGMAIFRTPNMANVLGIYSRYMDLTHQTGFTEYSLMQLLNQADFSDVQLHLPQWDETHPLTPRLRESAAFHRSLFASQDRVTPKCFEKNLVMWARKAV